MTRFFFVILFILMVKHPNLSPLPLSKARTLVVSELFGKEDKKYMPVKVKKKKI